MRSVKIMLMNQIQSMLKSCETGSSFIPPSTLYNEGWMLRILLHWFAAHSPLSHPLSFPEDGRWFSEALLTSAFLARYQGDQLAETWTHADGVIGHFAIGNAGKGDLSLLPDGTHFVALEAKMFSPLSPGTTNARYYNQAARYVACIAEVLRQADRRPPEMSRLGFYIVAPQSQIAKEVFTKHVSHSSIQEVVKRRVDEYGGEKRAWFDEWFLPTFQCMDIQMMSWEALIDLIHERDPKFGEEMQGFYHLCLSFNGKK